MLAEGQWMKATHVGVGRSVRRVSFGEARAAMRDRTFLTIHHHVIDDPHRRAEEQA
jgi:hypothetical protein